jgi:predicted nucleic acid-binding protein
VIRLPPHLVVDAWPVMEWIQRKEPVFSDLVTVIEAATSGEVKLSMSRINHGEVIYLIRKNFPADEAARALSLFRELPITLHSVPYLLIDAAVELKSKFSISFADAFAAALAIELSVALLTGDRDLLLLKDAGLLQIHWIGQ